MKKIKMLALAAITATGTQATAHGIEATTQNIQLAAGTSETVSVSCHGHHNVTGGGYDILTQINPTGPIVVTASYPSAKNTWSVDVANRSGRPTNNSETQIAVYAICSGGHR